MAEYIDINEVDKHMKHWLKQMGVLLAWLVSAALAVWIMIAIRTALLAGLQTWYVGSSIPRSWRARAWGQGYVVISGLILLIFIFAIDGYLRDGLEKGDTFRRFAKVIGIGLLVLFPADLVTLLAQQSTLGRLSLALLALELLGGAGLLAYAIIKNPRRKREPTRGEMA